MGREGASAMASRRQLATRYYPSIECRPPDGKDIRPPSQSDVTAQSGLLSKALALRRPFWDASVSWPHGVASKGQGDPSRRYRIPGMSRQLWWAIFGSRETHPNWNEDLPATAGQSPGTANECYTNQQVGGHHPGLAQVASSVPVLAVRELAGPPPAFIRSQTRARIGARSYLVFVGRRSVPSKRPAL